MDQTKELVKTIVEGLQEKRGKKCNGSTTDSGPVCPSSNLGRTTRKPRYSIRVARLSCFLSLAFGCSGDLHLETSPYTYLGFHRNLSSEPIHEHLANGKPQSGPLHVIVLFEIA